MVINYFFKIVLIFLLFASQIYSQIGGVIGNDRVTNWKDSGLTFEISQHSSDNALYITDYTSAQTDSGYFDDALDLAMADLNLLEKNVIFFPGGEYHFRRPVVIISEVVFKGEGSDKTKFYFQLNGQTSDCFKISGGSGELFTVTNPITKGDLTISYNSKSKSFDDAELVEIIQGNNFNDEQYVYQPYQKGQVLNIISFTNNLIEVAKPIRLDYDLMDEWGEPLEIRSVTPVQKVGLEDLYITRTDTPPLNGGSLINFLFAYNCWVSGVELYMGANHHITISHSKNIEVRGCYLNQAYSYGMGGNGYGVNINSSSSDCLIEDNIFDTLRHSMIFNRSANGNVFGFNSSVNKPDDNMSQASLSIHGYFPYLNLFEGNYAEYASVDFVWGSNGPYNTFFRNYIYHEGYFAGFFNNQLIKVAEGTDNNNIVSNLAYTDLLGENNFVLSNYPLESLPTDETHSEYSYYHEKIPEFFFDDLSWPSFGLPIQIGADLFNKIPSMNRLEAEKKTVSAKPFIIVSVEEFRKQNSFILKQNYPNPFNPNTVISYNLHSKSDVLLTLYNILGQKIKILVEKRQNAGSYQIEFNADNLPSGIYLYELKANDFCDSKKMIFLK